MDFAYYVISKKDMTLVDGAEDMVGAIKIAQQIGTNCLIMQGCIITEVGEDEVIEEDKTEDVSDTSTTTTENC